MRFTSAAGRVKALRGLDRSGSATLVAAADSSEQSLVLGVLAVHAGHERVSAIVADPLYGREPALAARFGLRAVLDPVSCLALDILAAVRGPIATALGSLRRGGIHVQRIVVRPGSRAAGRSLRDLEFPAGVRIAAITRAGRPITPAASTILREGDELVLVSNMAVADTAGLRLGSPREAVPSLRLSADPSLRLAASTLAEALTAHGLDVTLSLRGEHPSPRGPRRSAAEGRPEAHLEFTRPRDLPDPFGLAVSLRIRSSASRVTALESVARRTAALVPNISVQRVGTLLPGKLDVFLATARPKGRWLHMPLRNAPGLRGWIVLGLEARGGTYLPHPDDVIQEGETVVVAGPPDRVNELHRGLCGPRGVR